LKAGVIVFPGSNCDYDSYYALKDILGVNTEFIWHKETSLKGYDFIFLPGGFSYGDYLRSGAIARFSPVMQELIKRAGEGVPVLGVCNGFQVLTESHLLPGALMKNKNLRFICRHVNIRVEENRSEYLNGLTTGKILNIPIAHGEGCFYIDDDGLKELYDNGQILFKYVDDNGEPTEKANPNGSVDNIAGICNKKGNVIGMMPHPERAIESLLGSDDGREILKSIVDKIG
jgi:phosphoribosylformylglycinamidine synthase